MKPQKMLPIGTEFEHEYPLSHRSTSTDAYIFTYRVVGYNAASHRMNAPATYLTAQLEPMKSRRRRSKALTAVGSDAFGTVIWKADFIDPPASPTWRDLIDEIGIVVSKPTPRATIRRNVAAAVAERRRMDEGQNNASGASP